MLDVDVNHRIILMYFREHLSLRQISKQLNICRKTITLRVNQYKEFQAGSIKTGSTGTLAIAQYLQKGTVYDTSSRIPRRLNEDISALIHSCLDENETKRGDGRRKQQLRKIEIFEKLKAAGHLISYSTVCKYITDKELHAHEAYIKQDYEPGTVCEFDWAEVQIKLGGQKKRLYLAVFTSAFSNYRYALLFERQNTLSFKESHILFFDHLGGVYHQMVYDNMRVAVAQFVGKHDKKPTQALMELARWYQNDWRFCNICSGNEKGHVERSVDVIRHKSFSLLDEFEDFEQAQSYLLECVSKLNDKVPYGCKQSPSQRLEQERASLYSHPGRMECFTADYCKVDKYATICINTNHYSVPDNLVGKLVFVKSYSSQLRISYEQKELCTPPRSYERYSWHIDINHYLVTLQRKPGAFNGSVALLQAPDWLRTLYQKYFKVDPKGFVELLQYCQLNDISHDRIEVTVNTLANQYPNSVDTDHMLALLGNEPEQPGVVHDPSPLGEIELQSMENIVEMTSFMNQLQVAAV